MKWDLIKAALMLQQASDRPQALLQWRYSTGIIHFKLNRQSHHRLLNVAAWEWRIISATWKHQHIVDFYNIIHVHLSLKIFLVDNLCPSLAFLISLHKPGLVNHSVSIFSRPNFYSKKDSGTVKALCTARLLVMGINSDWRPREMDGDRGGQTWWGEEAHKRRRDPDDQ